MAVNAPRAGFKAFSGGPFGIGWAPLAIGGLALVAGVFLFSRRGGGGQAQPSAQAQPGSMPLTSQPSVNVFPYPTGTASGTGSNISAGQLDGQGGLPPTTPPPPSQPAGTLTGSLAGPATPTFWRNPVSGAIYLVNAQGKSYLSGSQWASIQSSYGGNAPYTNVDPAQLAALPNVNLAA